ncbi:hypothetical protein TraAM80_02730 [Trypanosoma rangeli]|uniref:Ubiquitin-like domain-containing protein n=1 Tax=Trypanosoma rangeli TaxID=5698 RepID=A0A3R7KRT6_TRYRA|nr:uncharacterized protein TraAM80_02730 [Trypanosoma rangeli]RNF08430.1 hypothetical protein TraAM80_02730 [Trypanosoma rangeli]|eukprot:RNF08430.1 hypothetical protein TraAM80_02730 [Trypanosoma rangeli]
MACVQIRSIRGEIMDAEVPKDCTVGDLREYLIGYYGYPPGTSLAYDRHVVGDARLVQEFPFGSLVLVSPQDAPQWCYQAQQEPLMNQHHEPQWQQQQRPRSQSNQQQHRAQQQPYNQQQQQPHSEQRTGSRTRRLQYQPYHKETQQLQQQQQQQNYGHQAPQQTRQEPYTSTFSMGAQQQQLHKKQRQQQQQEREDQHSLDSRDSKSEALDAFSGSLPSGAHSSSMHSGGMRTPRANNDKKQPVGLGKRANSDAHMSTPQRSPSRTKHDEKEIPLNLVGNPSRSSAPIVSTCETGSPEKTPRLNTQDAGLRHASLTSRDTNAEATRALSAHTGDATPVAPHISLKCTAPALKKNIYLELSCDATLGDLLLEVLSQEPRLAGAKVVFRGKLLSGSDVKLNSYGIHGGAPPASLISINPDASGLYTLYFASHEYSEPQKVMLLEIETDTVSIEAAIKDGGLSMHRRKGYYEELMRILFRTDNLQDLEGEWRSRRKDAVVRVTQLQDMLDVESVS